jgi:hypothetical protein
MIRAVVTGQGRTAVVLLGIAAPMLLGGAIFEVAKRLGSRRIEGASLRERYWSSGSDPFFVIGEVMDRVSRPLLVFGVLLVLAAVALFVS